MDDYNLSWSLQKRGVSMPTPYFRLFPYGWDIDVFYTRIRGRNVECAIFCKRVSQPFLGSLKEEDNAPRRPSEVTDTILALKYRKIGALGFWGTSSGVFGHFSGGKTKTSDFFRANIRGFASKVRMFMPKKSDVFSAFSRLFRPISAIWWCAVRLNGAKSGMCHHYRSLYFVMYMLQNARFWSVFSAGRDTAYCQNFWRFSLSFSPFMHRVYGPKMLECAKK